MKLKKKKILLLNSSLAGGGAESVCVSIANKFSDKGWSVDLAVLNTNNETFLYRIFKSVKLITLNVSHARYAALPLIKYIFKNKPKIILVFNYELSVMLVILRFLFRLDIKIIARNINTLTIKLRQFEDQNFWTRYIVLPLVKFCYQNVDHVVNQCHGMRDDLIHTYPKLINNSSVIYNPIPDHIEDYTRKHDLSKIKKEEYILCVGRLEKQKAFHYAIETFAKISNKFPKLRLKIIGKGNLEYKLRQKAIDCHIAQKVDFLGFQKNIIPFYLHAKATVLTSNYEGYPNVLIESIIMNTPVVSFDCPNGPAEIIKNGVNGYLVKNLDASDLENKLLETLKREFNYLELKNSVKKNQIDQVFQRYEKLINFYNLN